MDVLVVESLGGLGVGCLVRDGEWGADSRLGHKKKKPGGARRVDARIYEGKFSSFGRTCQDNNFWTFDWFGMNSRVEERFLRSGTARPAVPPVEMTVSCWPRRVGDTLARQAVLGAGCFAVPAKHVGLDLDRLV